MENNARKANGGIDPLANPNFRKPGLAERIAENIFGHSRPFDCVQIEVTSACGGSCVYCPHTAQADAWHTRHMDDNAFARLWPLLRLSQRAHLQGWGEPLLHPRFFDMQALAAKAGCKTSTTSCGMVMDEAKADRLAASGMDLIAFSVAGTDEASNAARQGIPLDRVRQSIGMLAKAIARAGKGPELHLAYLLLADRMDAAKKLPELMEELGVEMAVVSTLDYLACPQHRDLAFAPEETAKIEAAREILADAAERAEKAGRVIQYALPGQTQAEEGCRENVGRCLYAAANGDISPCVYLNVPGSDPAEKRRVFGNILVEDPIAIWKKPEYAQFRRQLLAGEADTACLHCSKRMEQAR